MLYCFVFLFSFVKYLLNVFTRLTWDHIYMYIYHGKTFTLLIHSDIKIKLTHCLLCKDNERLMNYVQ